MKVANGVDKPFSTLRYVRKRSRVTDFPTHCKIKYFAFSDHRRMYLDCDVDNFIDLRRGTNIKKKK